MPCVRRQRFGHLPSPHPGSNKGLRCAPASPNRVAARSLALGEQRTAHALEKFQLGRQGIGPAAVHLDRRAPQGRASMGPRQFAADNKDAVANQYAHYPLLQWGRGNLPRITDPEEIGKSKWCRASMGPRQFAADNKDDAFIAVCNTSASMGPRQFTADNGHDARRRAHRVHASGPRQFAADNTAGCRSWTRRRASFNGAAAICRG